LRQGEGRKGMSEEPIPIYANGFFNFSRDGKVTQFTIFYYNDEKQYYASLDRRALRKELLTIKRNLQYFLDQEEITINGRKVDAKVKWVKIGLLTPSIPFIEFIVVFSGELRKGINIYRNVYEEEVTEYPYEATWVLPGKVIEVKLGGRVKVNKNIVRLKVNKNEKVGGEEEIKFLLL
jgi:hypothetical protein